MPLSEGRYDDTGQIENAISVSEEMISWHMPIKAKVVEKLFRQSSPFTHHRQTLLFIWGKLNQDISAQATKTFSTQTECMHHSPYDHIWRLA